jgi:hypothetical protein
LSYFNARMSGRHMWALSEGEVRSPQSHVMKLALYSCPVADRVRPILTTQGGEREISSRATHLKLSRNIRPECRRHHAATVTLGT